MSCGAYHSGIVTGNVNELVQRRVELMQMKPKYNINWTFVEERRENIALLRNIYGADDEDQLLECDDVSENNN
jgi:hypothetical protein